MSGGAGDVGLAPVDRGYHALRSPEWRAMEEANARAMVAFQAGMAARSGGYIPDAPGAPGEAPTAVPDLPAAKAAAAEAKARLARVRDALGRAQDRADADEHALASFSGIDDRLTRLMAARAYDADAAPDLPIAEQVALSARARGIERHELSQRALRYVEGELRTAEAAEQQTDRQVRAAASAVMMAEAAFLARELEGVQVHEAELRARLRAYADATLPGLGGATPLPAAAVQALNAVREEVGRDIGRETELRRQHAALIADD